jgi:chromosome segregation ATPase
MDTEGVLGTELDGIFDWAKKAITGAKRKIKAWVGDNTLTPPDDFHIHNLKTYKDYTESLKKYQNDLITLKGNITTNDSALKEADKAASAAKKTNDNGRIALENKVKELTLLQKSYEKKKNALESIIECNKELLVRYKETYNEMKDYEYRMSEADSEDTELQQDQRSLEHEDQEIALILSKK